MAKNAPKTGDLVEARVLVDCAFGKVDDVVSVEPAVAEAHPELDTHPDAVAYARAPKPEA
jgi:hypothetical protein